MFLAPLLGSSQEMTKSLSAEEGREGESDKHTDRCYTNWSRQICTYVIRQIRYTSEQGKSAQICILCYINFSALTLGVKKIWLQICVKISLNFSITLLIVILSHTKNIRFDSWTKQTIYIYKFYLVGPGESVKCVIKANPTRLAPNWVPEIWRVSTWPYKSYLLRQRQTNCRAQHC